MKDLLSRRGLLVSLGAKIADLTPEEEIELAKPAELVTKTGLKIDVTAVEVKQTSESIDVTSFGDPSPRFVRGRSTVYFEIRGYPHAGFSIEELLGNEIPFEYSFGKSKVSANLLVTKATYRGSVGSVVEVELSAVAVGGVQFEQKLEHEKPEPQTNVRRGIKL